MDYDAEKAPDNGGLDAIAEQLYPNDGNRKSPSYLAEYESLFRGRRNDNWRILELGVASGASLLLWRDYLPNATIVGIDVNEPAERIVGQDRIHFIRASQDDTSALDLAGELAGGLFDLIVDDASHVGYLTKRALLHLFPLWLKPGGYYVIEDFGAGMLAAYPDGEVFREPPFDDACPEACLFAGHQSGVVGVVKQLIDYMMTELMTATPSVLHIERINILANVAFVQKSFRSTEPTRMVPPASVTRSGTDDAGRRTMQEIRAILQQHEMRLATVERAVGRLRRVLAPARSVWHLLLRRQP